MFTIFLQTLYQHPGFGCTLNLEAGLEKIYTVTVADNKEIRLMKTMVISQ